MKEFTISMAIVDYIPVVLFLLAVLIILKDTKGKMKFFPRALYTVGSLFVFAAGAIKATYKLLYAAGVGDFEWMSNQFFANQAFGFLLAGVGMVIYATRAGKRANGLIPVMGLVGIMVVGLGALDAGYCFLASKLKKKGALVCFIISFFMCMMMGYLSSRDFTQSYMNWVAQGINIVGQGLLYIGCRSLHKAGLADL